MVSACTPAGTRPMSRTETRTNDVAIANLRLGTAYMEQGDYEKSLEKLEKALRADPDYYATLNVLGILHQRMGRNEDAERYFKRALSKYPNDSPTLNNYGQFLCATGRLDEAENSFIKAAENPLYDSPQIAYTNAGLCALKNDRREQAEDYFRKALEKEPQMALALINLSEINLENGNHLSARAYLQRYSESGSHNPRSLWLGVRIERALGDRDAEASYALLLKNNFPDSREAQLLRQSTL